jgi:rod shape-determining protein MreD
MSGRDALKAALLLWVAVLLQVSLLGGLGLLSPDLVLVVVVVLALLRGPVFGSVTGFAAGLLVDVATLSPLLGVSSLVLATAGYWSGRYGETTGRDRSHAPYLSVAVATVLVSIATLALDGLLQQPAFAQRVLFHELPGRLLVDLLLTVPVYRVARRFLRRGGTLERTAEVRLLG